MKKYLFATLLIIPLLSGTGQHTADSAAVSNVAAAIKNETLPRQLVIDSLRFFRKLNDAAPAERKREYDIIKKDFVRVITVKGNKSRITISAKVPIPVTPTKKSKRFFLLRWFGRRTGN